MLIKAKVYKIFAVVFAVAGLGLFAFVFSTRAGQEGAISILGSPASVVLVVFPFIPALVFSWISAKAAAKVEEFFDEMETGAETETDPEIK